MGNLKIEGTERSPEVDFCFDTNVYTLRGESYPEDVNEFFGPVMSQLESHLHDVSNASVQFIFELIYFNSSSAKILMGLFELLDETAQAGNKVHIVWKFEEDDDNMEEMGEEFCEDLESATFELLPVEL